MKLQILANYFSAKLTESLNTFLSEWNNSSEYVLQKTSGSTGKPQEIRLLKRAMINSARLTLTHFGLDDKNVFLICLDPDYIAGKMMIVRAMLSGASVILTNPTTPLDFAERKLIDFCAMVPLQVDKELIQHPEQLKSIKNLIIGGAPINARLEQQIINSKLNAFAAFGMTETTSHIALRKIDSNQYSFAAIGDTTFTTNSEHQLIINAPQLEINNLITNDIVELLDERHFQWKGRKDFIINSGGIKFNPEEIEKKIEQNGLTNRFFIFGENDEKFGSKISLVIENNSSFETLHFLSNLGKYEQPKSVYFISAFAETATGKINRIETLKRLRIDT